VATKLGLADQLSQGAKSCEELATEMGVHTNSLLHILGLLAQVGIVAVDKNGNYKLTSFGSDLRSDSPTSLRANTLALGEISFPAWGNLLYSIKTGRAAFDKTFQMSVYEYLNQNAEANTNFNRWMEEIAREWTIPVLDGCDFSRVNTFVDVGGNIGTLTIPILKKYPNLQAILFDQPHVVSEAEKVLKAADVAERCQVIGGSFFESVPVGGDLYILSRVLLNWDNDHALKILKNCRAVMTNSAKLLIIDSVLPKEKVNTLLLLSSLSLLVYGGRLMRTEDEYYELLDKAGFQSPRLIHTGGMISFIETVPM